MHANTTPTYGLTHLAIAVSNLERTRRFYCDVFDMEVMYNEPDFLQLTTPGAHDIIVFEKAANNLAGVKGGIDHLGFRLRRAEDIGVMREKILAAGATIKDEGEFVPGSPYIFFYDPDGYVIEVWYEKL